MTKVAYLECPTGIAGDMCLGALVHAGVPLDYLSQTLARLGLPDPYRLWSESAYRNGQQATRVHIELAIATANDSSSHAAHSHAAHPAVDPHPHPHAADHFVASTIPVSEPVAALPADELKGAPPDHATHQHRGRHLPEIEQLITAANLPARAEAWSLAVFRQLALAEGAVHGIAPEQVHFHEVGAVDAIVDIVGTCLGLDWLDIDQLYCSPMPVGGGMVRAAHGLLPVPAPAVLKLWQMRQVPVYSNGIDRELVTPTGAAIATTLATRFGPPPAMTIQQVGLGAGSRELPLPNILRLWIGEPYSQAIKAAGEAQSAHPPVPAPTASAPGPASLSTNAAGHSAALASSQDRIAVLETQIDDLNPQAIGYVFEVLFAAGALDVFTQAIGMKKSRPGVLLTVLCPPNQREACEAVLFRETTTLGIRHSIQQRTILQREIQSIETRYGPVRVKVARRERGGTIVNAQPEYEDCAQLAQQLQLPWREIHRLALQSWSQKADLSAPGATCDHS